MDTCWLTGSSTHVPVCEYQHSATLYVAMLAVCHPDMTDLADCDDIVA